MDDGLEETVPEGPHQVDKESAIRPALTMAQVLQFLLAHKVAGHQIDQVTFTGRDSSFPVYVVDGGQPRPAPD